MIAKSSKMTLKIKALVNTSLELILF